MCECFFRDPRDGVEVACSGCGGEGVIETGPHGYDPRNGEPILWSYTCRWCNGTGAEFVPAEPIFLEDLLELDDEIRAADGIA